MCCPLFTVQAVAASVDKLRFLTATQVSAGYSGWLTVDLDQVQSSSSSTSPSTSSSASGRWIRSSPPSGSRVARLCSSSCELRTARDDTRRARRLHCASLSTLDQLPNTRSTFRILSTKTTRSLPASSPI